MTDDAELGDSPSDPDEHNDAAHDHAEHDHADDGDVSLEELGAAYARILAEAEGTPLPEDASNRSDDPADGAGDDKDQAEEANPELPVSIEGIVEAAIFVGHPENKTLTAKQLAGMIRNVSPQEIEETVDQLNDSYRDAGQAIRIERDAGGFRMGLVPEMETVRRAFYGKVREAHLSLGAVEVLALVAYQPGITAQQVQDQRGKDSGALLNQMVRRQLLRVERVQPSEGGRAVATYFPTDRFLQLFGLSSLEDLPHVEEEGVVNHGPDV